MRIMLAGATGTLGGPLVEQLLHAGHDVVGITRSREGAERLVAVGAMVIRADVLDREALLRAGQDQTADAVIHQLTALKKAPARHQHMHDTNRLRIQGSDNLVEFAQHLGASRFVTQSIVFGYGYRDHGAAFLTEDSSFGTRHGNSFDEHIAAMVHAEKMAIGTPGLDGVCLRYGLMYGGDVGTVVRMLRKRALPVARNGGRLPFVHHRDAAAATVAAVERGRPGAVYNVVDDAATTFRSLITGIAEAFGAPTPMVLPQWLLDLAAPYGGFVLGRVSMHVSNACAKQELDWEPTFPTYRDFLNAC